MKVQIKNDSTKYYLDFLCQKYISQNSKDSNSNHCTKTQYSQTCTNSTTQNKTTK